MKILNFGSLNLDKVYTLPHFPRPGETLAAEKVETFCGGKGLNQSVALARAGGSVFHAGCVGASDGGMLLDCLRESGVDISLVRRLEDCSTGHAIIQVDASGENCILLFGGANQAVTRRQIDETLTLFVPGDLLVLQNEISELEYLIAAAADKGMAIALNPSPMTEALTRLPLEKVTWFLLNEGEAGDLCGGETSADKCLDILLRRYPESRVVLTLGTRGSIYRDRERTVRQRAYPVQVVDTTAAGDTFTGFFLSGIAAGEPVEQAMEEAARAASIAIGRQGAAPSVPTRAEVLSFRG